MQVQMADTHLYPIRYRLDRTDKTKHWKVVLLATSLDRDTIHEFKIKENHNGCESNKVTHLMFIALPDGGIHRIGVYGKSS